MGPRRGPIRVLLADDHDFFRASLAAELNATQDIQVVAECGDGDQVDPAAAQARPDVAVLDVEMPRMSGIHAARALRVSHPQVAVLMLSSTATTATIRAAARAGARGYLLKGTHSVRAAIRRLAAGDTAWEAGPRARQPRQPAVTPVVAPTPADG